MTLLLSATLVACNQSSSENVAEGAARTGSNAPAVAKQSAMTPEQLGEIGAQIEKEKDRAPEILSKHGLDPKSFETQIRKVAEDPEASKRYAAAYRKAKA